jgi:transposase
MQTQPKTDRKNEPRRFFKEEYKREALELWRSSGRSATAVAEELGIRAPMLYKWAKEERRTTGKAAPPAQLSLEELQAEIRRLREENAKLLEQREILKKSLGIFSEPPPRGMPKSSR